MATPKPEPRGRRRFPGFEFSGVAADFKFTLLNPGCCMQVQQRRFHLLEHHTAHIEKSGAARAPEVFTAGRAEHVAAPGHRRRGSSARPTGVAWSRNGMPARRACSPTLAAGCTRPPLVGTWVRAINFTRWSSSRRRASRSTSPAWSLSTTQISTPVCCATCKNAM